MPPMFCAVPAGPHVTEVELLCPWRLFSASFGLLFRPSGSTQPAGLRIHAHVQNPYAPGNTSLSAAT
jgi:hypothetical protein